MGGWTVPGTGSIPRPLGLLHLGILQEEEKEKLDALQGILSAFLEEDSLLTIFKEIVEQWSLESWDVLTKMRKEDEIQIIAT